MTICLRELPDPRLPTLDQIPKTDRQSSAIVSQLNQVETADRQLHIADEGLSSPESLGQGDLHHAGIFAQFPKQRSQFQVLDSIQALSHGRLTMQMAHTLFGSLEYSDTVFSGNWV